MTRMTDTLYNAGRDPQAGAGVAGDVEGIFAPLQARQAAVDPHQPRHAEAQVRTVTRDAAYARLTPRIGAAVAALAVAVTVGAVWIKPVLDEQSRAAAASALLASEPPAVATNSAQAQPLETAVSPQVPTEYTYIPPVQITPSSPPAPIAPEQARDMRAKSAAGCRGLSGQRRQTCFHAQVMAADRRLRRAYARAGDAGVSRPAMVSYRNRWAALRRQAIRDPGRVIAGYGAMATELSREARLAERRYGRAAG